MNGKVLYARFFKLSTGKEPVRDWLKSQTKETKKVIGEDINTIERTWPIGFPLVRKLDNRVVWKLQFPKTFRSKMQFCRL